MTSQADCGPFLALPPITTCACHPYDQFGLVPGSPANGCWRLLLLPLCRKSGGRCAVGAAPALLIFLCLRAGRGGRRTRQECVCSDTSPGYSVEYSQGLPLGLKTELYSSPRFPCLLNPISLHLRVPQL